MNERKKLTTAAFKRKSCPKWACYAAVNKSGLTYYFGWEPILGDDGWIPSPQEIKPGFLGVFDATDWEHSLIKRTVTTNLDWLCKHPQELAKKLVDFDISDRFCVAPDGKVFDGYAEEGGIYNLSDASKRCVKHIVKWLKREHKKVKND